MTRFAGPARTLAVASITAAVFAASLAAAPQTPAAKVPAGFPAVGAPAIITLVTAGGEPRRPLRYAVANGRKDHMTLVMDMSVAIDTAGMSIPMTLPELKMGADATVTDVSASGDITYKIAFTDMNWVNTGNADPNVLAAIQSMSVDLTTLSGGGVVSPRGIVRNATIDTSKLNNPQMAQMMGAMSSALQQLSLPLPEEAVGLGAHWQVRQAIPTPAMQTFQKAEVELTALDATSCTLKISTDTTAPPQPVSMPNLPAGIEASLESLTATGTGTMTVHLDSLVPTSSMSAKTTTVMNVAMGGDSQQMSAQASIQVKVTPGK